MLGSGLKPTPFYSSAPRQAVLRAPRAGNTIRNAAYAPLLVTAVRDALLANNTFINSVCTGASMTGNAFGWLQPPTAPVFIDDANVAIRLSGNLFVRNQSCPVGPNITDPVKYGPNGGADYNRFLYS